MTRSLPFAATALILAAAAAACDFPYWLNDTEVWGLASASAADAASCAAACCAAGASCTLYQWCPAGAGCTPASSCWIGATGGQTRRVAGWISAAVAPMPDAYYVNASARAPAAVPIAGIPPSTSPAGVVLSLDSRALRVGGVPLLPFGGEMHPSRVPASAWDADLAKMKAGGLDIVSSYLMWIHVEESEGVLDFSGNRNVTSYLLAAQRAGLMVALRIGPWAHGEVRNGGFPNWLESKGIPLRRNSTAFLNLVRPWYAGIAAQIQGLSWAEGGPLVSVQIDNESDDVAYLEALRDLAVSVGIAPFFFTKTGWPTPNAPVPVGSLVPLEGGYSGGWV